MKRISVKTMILASTLAVFGLNTTSLTADSTADKKPIPARISVMSYNIRFSSADDGTDSWPYRKATAMEVIDKYTPNLLGLQEALMGQTDYIASQFSMYHFYGIGREPNGLGEMQTGFFNKMLFTPTECGTFWLSTTPEVPGSRSWGAGCTRQVTWMKLRHLPSGKYFYWFNTHFDHVSEEARQGGAKLLLKKINEICGKLPVIITGDFNSPEDSAAWNVLTSGGFKDSWLEAESRKGPEVTFHGFFKKDIDLNGKNRIDWILTRGIKKVNYCETITYTNNNKYPSDHFPVYAELVL